MSYGKLNWRSLPTTLPIGLSLSILLMGCGTFQSRVVANPDPAPDSPVRAEQPSTVSQGQVLPITAQVQLGDQQIDLEVTRTIQEQALGLMFRPELPANRGMLFQFQPPRPVSFWMKNVPVALDMVFIRDERIVAIAHEVPPCQSDPCPTYGPEPAIDTVIELRAGRARELGLQAGDPAAVQFLPDS